MQYQLEPQLPLFKSRCYKAAMGALHFAVMENKLMLILGESGSGKTTLLLSYSNTSTEMHYIFCSPNMNIKDLLQKMGYALNLQLRGNAYQMQQQITDELLVNPRHCFMLDECEYLNRNNISKLEVLRQIWDETRTPFIFCGTYSLEDELKGSSKKGTNHSQIYRRLYKTNLGIMTQQEVYDYLDLLEKDYAVHFLTDARSDLYSQCRDRENGGMGNFIELIELVFAKVRPEWKRISLQKNYIRRFAMKQKLTDFRLPDQDRTTQQGEGEPTEAPDDPPADLLPEGFEPVDVSKLKITDISSATIRSASHFKVTR